MNKNINPVPVAQVISSHYLERCSHQQQHQFLLALNN